MLYYEHNNCTTNIAIYIKFCLNFVEFLKDVFITICLAISTFSNLVKCILQLAPCAVLAIIAHPKTTHHLVFRVSLYIF